MAQPKSVNVGSSVLSPVDMKKRKVIYVPTVRTDYTLYYHYGDLDKTPVRGVSYCARTRDGAEFTGFLDDLGRAKLTNVVAGEVKVSYQYDAPVADDPEITKARQKLTQALNKIVEHTRQEMAGEWKQWNEAGLAKKGALQVGNFALGVGKGAWNWADGIIETVWQLGVVLFKIEMMRSWLYVKLLKGDFQAIDQKIVELRKKQNDIIEFAGEGKELFILIVNDPQTRKALAEFPMQWWSAIPPDEQTELQINGGMQIIMDVLAAALLAAFSSGSGGVAYGGARMASVSARMGVRVIELFEELKTAFRELAKALKGRKRKITETKTANADKVIETKYVPPPPEKFALINGQKFYPKKYSTLYHGGGNPSLGVPSTYKEPRLVKDHIMRNGLPARGTDVDLIAHSQTTHGNPNTAFRGATHTPISQEGEAGAALWGGEGDFVVKLKDIEGYDINQLMQGRVKDAMGRWTDGRFVGEQEVAVHALVPPENIENVLIVKRKPSGRLFAEPIK